LEAMSKPFNLSAGAAAPDLSWPAMTRKGPLPDSGQTREYLPVYSFAQIVRGPRADPAASLPSAFTFVLSMIICRPRTAPHNPPAPGCRPHLPIPRFTWVSSYGGHTQWKRLQPFIHRCPLALAVSSHLDHGPLPLAGLVAAPSHVAVWPGRCPTMCSACSAALAGWTAFLFCRRVTCASWPSLAAATSLDSPLFYDRRIRAHLLAILISRFR